MCKRDHVIVVTDGLHAFKNECKESTMTNIPSPHHISSGNWEAHSRTRSAFSPLFPFWAEVRNSLKMGKSLPDTPLKYLILQAIWHCCDVGHRDMFTLILLWNTSVQEYLIFQCFKTLDSLRAYQLKNCRKKRKLENKKRK